MYLFYHKLKKSVNKEKTSIVVFHMHYLNSLEKLDTRAAINNVH